MLAVAGGKGGVGKTTTALGVGAALVRRDRDAIVVDADRTMPDLGRRAGVDGGGVAAIAEGAPIDATVRRAADPPVAVIPAAPGLERSAIRRALRRLDASERRVVLDCAAGASRDAALPLRLADRSLLVTTPTGPGLRGAIKTAAMAGTLDAPPVGAVLTMAGNGPAVGDALDVPIIETTPSVQTPLTDRRVLPSYDRIVESCY